MPFEEGAVARRMEAWSNIDDRPSLLLEQDRKVSGTMQDADDADFVGQFPKEDQVSAVNHGPQPGGNVRPLSKTGRSRGGKGRLFFQSRDETQCTIGVILGDTEGDVTKICQRLRSISKPFHTTPARRAAMTARNSA